MKGFDVLKVKSAVKAHNKFDLSRTHLTTMDFGQIVPLLVEETVPGDKFNVNGQYFSRMAPLVKPTYGKFSFKTVAGFVPYHMIGNDIEAWLAGKSVWEGQTPTTRYFDFQQLDLFIRNTCADSTASASATANNCDYSYVDTSGNAKYVIFSNPGKYYVKVLNALGYALPQGVDLRTSSNWWTQQKAQKLSALPLLAFFKLYNDYMSQSQRFNSSQLTSFLNSVKYKTNVSGSYTGSTGAITATGLATMFGNLFLNYENDYFTSAWQMANNAINSMEFTNDKPTTASYSLLGLSTTDTYTELTVSNSSTRLGQKVLDMLKNFDNWVRRNNYSGSRAVQQVYSRFGIKTDEYRSHYANVISTDSMPIQVGDITATADAQNVPLGDYAGKGIVSGSKGFSVDVSDYGVLLVLGYFTVVPMNSFGFDRSVLRSSPFDYYNPEFDGVGVDAISLGEVWASPIVAGGSDTTLDKGVYGYTERYNSYRYGRDVITGEFRDYHKNADMSCWHTGRNLQDVREAGNLVAQSSSMNTLPQSDSEYNRIFSITSGDVDHFYLTANFGVSAVRPMMNLNQVVNLGEGDTVVPRNGNVIS